MGRNEEAIRFSRAPNVGSKIQRFIVILLQFIGFIAFLAQQRIGIVFGADDDAAMLSRAAAENLRERIVDLGTAFIKGGQILSARADLVGPIWMEVLSSLQADVPAVPYDEIKAVIFAELPKESLERIEWIARESINAASIGQVHRARLKSGGTDIVLKVQRPGIEELVRTDSQSSDRSRSIARSSRGCSRGKISWERLVNSRRPFRRSSILPAKWPTMAV